MASVMSSKQQQALVIYGCKKGYDDFVTFCLTNGYAYNYFPLLMLAVTKICKFRHYVHWEMVKEAMLVMNDLYVTTEIGCLVKTTKFHVGIIDILLVLKQAKITDKLSVFVAECTIEYFNDDYKNSTNPENREMAAKARDAYLKVLQNKDALFEYQSRIPRLLEHEMNRVTKLIQVLSDIIIEHYMHCRLPWLPFPTNTKMTEQQLKAFVRHEETKNRRYYDDLD
ncbi:hypothetical protein DdX_19761 [Ditylenchus destructor]|uniref:Uncharacterized protein n=1 Tax=Ditylenchus destructor TaxID=166010 RepID=A0AAD4QWZ8_9BILA|nr:hypothetical protein DdX_19761 [Ditylenchus destructor]